MSSSPGADLPPRPEGPLPVGISACLTGAEVRFDGGHKASSIPQDEVKGLFRFRPFCPEVAIGLGTPRKPIRLVERDGSIHAEGAVGDVTEALADQAEVLAPQLADVDGCIFMKDSPSCGLYRVKVYQGDGDSMPRRDGRGVFADAVARRFPLLPVEESGRLFDPVLRENFVTRVHVHAHWRALLAAGLTARRLIAFHSVHKLLVMAHDVHAYRALGRQLADLRTDLVDKATGYVEGLMTALGKPATRGGHANVLSHLQGYVKTVIGPEARQELAYAIESYRRGELPLLAPLTLLRHHLGTHDATYALDQVYLQPHPAEAGLRRPL